MKNMIVFVGRPNVGKSTIIRDLMGIKTVVGKKPGATRRIKVYSFAEKLKVVDLPGFGYMHGISKERIEEIKKEIVKFLENNYKKILVALHVIDGSTYDEISRRLEKKGIIMFDKELSYFLRELNIDTITVINKIDKIPKKNIDDIITRIYNDLGYSGNWKDNIYNFMILSAKKKQNYNQLRKAIALRLKSHGYDSLIKFLRRWK